MRPRDPDCDCEIEFPGARRIWCDHLLNVGPLSGSLADPEFDSPLVQDLADDLHATLRSSNEGDH